MNKKLVLLFGSTGMAGHIIYYYLDSTSRYQITDVAYRSKLTDNTLIIDVNNREQVMEVISQSKPDLIINCIGILIKGSRDYPSNAIFINAYFPHFLKECADKVGAKLIHISTDCVFSGKKGSYIEEDFRDADDVYGRSKALGEVINEKDLTLRTSIIGPELKQEGEGLFHWFMKQSGEISGYINAIWSGVTTLELAKAIDIAIKQEKTGLIQLSNGFPINKFALLELFDQIWKRDILIIPYEGLNIDKSIKKSSHFEYDVPSYREMLLELYNWMREHHMLYMQYH